MEREKILNIAKWTGVSLVGLMLIISALLLVFKNDIKSYALEEANKHLNKRVHIHHIDIGLWKTFPNLTLSFDDVLIHSKFDTIQTLDTAVYAQRIDLKFNLLDFMRRKYDVHRIDIKEAVLNLSVREDGSVNYDFLKESESDEKTPFEFNLKTINLLNTDFSYVNEATEQYYSGYFDDLKLKGSFTEAQFDLAAKTHFDIQSVRSKSLTLVENQSAVCDIVIQMDQINDVFAIKSADLAINKLPFSIRGEVRKDSVNFYIGSTGIDLEDFANNFSLQELDVVGKINGKGKVNFELFIEGDNSTTKAPAIYADFGVENGSLSDQGFSLTNIQVEGHYSNGIKDGTEEVKLSKLQFHSLNRDFRGQLSITDFEHPRLKGSANGILDLKAVHRLFGPFNLQELSGNVSIDGDFDLRFNNPNFNEKNLTVYHLRSKMNFNNVLAQFLEDDKLIKIPNGEIIFQNQVAQINDLLVTHNQSDVHLDGRLTNILNYFNNKGNLTIQASIQSSALHLDEIIASEAKTEEKTGEKKWIIPDDIAGKIDIQLNKVQYSQHVYSDIKGLLHIANRSLYFSTIEGVNAKTKVKGNLRLTEERPMYILVETNLVADNLGFQPVFAEWNNFEQEMIRSENIKGNAQVEIAYKSPVDLHKGRINKDELDVRAKISITNGALSNVQTFKEITQSLERSGAKLLISKNRIRKFEEKLLNLSFDKMENEIIIKNGVITIPRMTIFSNALDIDLEGIHSFANDIDYSFNFRFREIMGEQNSEFGDVVDDGTGFRIYLRMNGTTDAPNFLWDRESKKADQQERRQQAKDDLRSALKTGFGINKRDSSVQHIEQDTKREEQIIMDFGDEEEDEPTEKKKKNRLFDRWKKENKEPEPEFELGD